MALNPGSKAFVIYNQKILLILRDNKPDILYPNTWNFPGGGIETAETPLEALKRELDEEISVVPKDIQWLGQTTYPDGSITHRYICWLSDTEYQKLKLGNEGQKMEFFNYSEMFDLALSPNTRQYLEKCQQQIEQIVESPSSLTPFDTVI